MKVQCSEVVKVHWLSEIDKILLMNINDEVCVLL